MFGIYYGYSGDLRLRKGDLTAQGFWVGFTERGAILALTGAFSVKGSASDEYKARAGE